MNYKHGKSNERKILFEKNYDIIHTNVFHFDIIKQENLW